MPATTSGAYVSCYALAGDYVRATKMCIAALSADGMCVEEILQPIKSMPIAEWSTHIFEQWPEQADQMPTQAEFEESMRGGKVVYGPFGAYF